MEIIKQQNFYTIAIEQIKSIDYYKSQLDNFLLTESTKTYKNEVRLKEHLSVLFLIFKLTGVHQNYYYDEFEKPICRQTGQRLSISHSDNYAVVMIAEKGFLGIDIEESNRCMQRAAKKFINETEQQWIRSNFDLIRVWTAKEAIYKMIPWSTPDFKNDYIIYQDNTALIKKPFEKKIKIDTYQTENYFISWVFERI